MLQLLWLEIEQTNGYLGLHLNLLCTYKNNLDWLRSEFVSSAEGVTKVRKHQLTELPKQRGPMSLVLFICQLFDNTV